MDWSKLDGFLASKNVRARPPKVAVDRGASRRPKPPPTQGAIDAMREAMSADRRAYQKYRDNREQRRAEITKEVPELARYLKKLEALAPTADFPEKRECSYDLADLAQRYDLARIAKPYDRFLVYELTTEWVRKGFEAQCKKEGRNPHDVDPATFFVVPDPTTLDELRVYLHVQE